MFNTPVTVSVSTMAFLIKTTYNAPEMLSQAYILDFFFKITMQMNFAHE